uniref:Uncharacterized protein n=1 Tax=Solanum lycopersicum TaxID=4081 RepID=A0A3Q7H6I9_SOLLC
MLFTTQTRNALFHFVCPVPLCSSFVDQLAPPRLSPGFDPAKNEALIEQKSAPIERILQFLRLYFAKFEQLR